MFKKTLFVVTCICCLLLAVGCGQTDVTSDLFNLCDLSEDQIGDILKTTGTITFIDENPEGIFVEIEESGCKIGLFIPSETWVQWDSNSKGVLHKGATMEVWGRLILFENNFIIDVTGINQIVNEEAVAPPVEVEDFELLEVPETFILDVPLIYSGSDNLPGLCYLGAAGMLIKYEHPELDFVDIIALSGIGSSALHLNFPEMPSMLISPYMDQSIVFMLNNIGADYVLGYHKVGMGSDSFQPAGLPFENNMLTLLFFDDGEEALNALKHTISTGRPTMVYLNMFHVHDDFSKNSEYWKDFLGKDRASHYMVVTGYDTDVLYLNDPTDPTGAANILTADMDNFLLAWEETTDIPNAPPLGPFWMLYLENPGDIPNSRFVIEMNLIKAVDAPSQIRSFAEKPDNTEFTRFLLLELGNARMQFGNYLNRIGYQEAAVMYIESGNLMRTMALENTVQSSLLQKAADLEETAIGLLQE